MKKRAILICVGVLILIASYATAQDLTNALQTLQEKLVDLQQALQPSKEDLNDQLIKAVFANDPENVQKYLKQRADPNALRDSWTALMVAAYFGIEEIVQVLLNSKANPNIKNKDGRTALMIASYANEVAVIHKLAEAQVELDAQDNDGWTALMWAVNSNHPEVVKALLQKGARRDIQDKTGRTALDYANQKEATTDKEREAASKIQELLQKGV